MSRPHSARLLKTLDEVRRELVDTTKGITEAEFAWVPAEGMKSYPAILQEIGTMEKLVTAWVSAGKELPWDMPSYVRDDSVGNALEDLAAIRAETVAFLQGGTEERRQSPM